VSVEWAAGLFEGEGCITVKTQKGLSSPMLALSMTDEDIVRHFHRVVVHGNFTGPYDWGNKPVWRWQCVKLAHVFELMALLGPYLGTRRQERIAEVSALYVSTREGRPTKRGAWLRFDEMGVQSPTARRRSRR
jgi:hypothetical protein